MSKTNPDFSTLKVGDKVIRYWGLYFVDSFEEAVATITKINQHRIYIEFESPAVRRINPLNCKCTDIFSRKTGLQLHQGNPIMRVWFETATPDQIAAIEAKNMPHQ